MDKSGSALYLYLTTSLFWILSCSYGIPIRYRLVPASVSTVENLKIEGAEDNRSILAIYEKGGVRVSVIVFDKSLLASQTGQMGEQSQAIPEALFAGVSVLNYGREAIRFDIRDLVLYEGKNRLPAMTFRDYDGSMYGLSLSGYPYYWTFEQKESHRFLHPVPDWHEGLWKRDTSSSAERSEREKSLYDLFERSRSADVILQPGKEIRGISLFHQPSECDCTLRYEENASARSLQGVALPDIPFTIRIEKIFDETKGGNSEALPRFSEQYGRISSERQDLYMMHEQLRIHDTLRTRQALTFSMRLDHLARKMDRFLRAIFD